MSVKTKKLYYYKGEVIGQNGQKVISYNVDFYPPTRPEDTLVSRYEYLMNVEPGVANGPRISNILSGILDIVWEIITSVAQKLIAKNVIFADLWLANLYKAFAYDIGKILTIKDGDFAAFEQVLDDISATNMEEFLDIIDVFNDEGKFDKGNFVKLLVTRMAIKNVLGNGALVNPDGSLKDPFGDLQTDAKPFDPNKIP